ncbi:MAG: hypothetical protein N2234_01170 [Planctomycetota bacterium]|nr:hypothetical protein [Planctomycetota bacterium]
MRKPLILLTGLLLLAPLLGDKYDSTEWKRLTTKFQNAISEGDSAAFRDLAAQIAEDDSARAAEVLVSAVARISGAEYYEALKGALASLKSTNAQNCLDRLLQKGAQPEARSLILQVYAYLKDAKKIPLIVQILKNRKENLMVVKSAAEALGDIGDKSAIMPLIEFLEIIEKERGDVPLRGTDWYEAVKSLKKLTGVEYHSASDWRKWLEATGGDVEPPKGDSKSPRTELAVPPSVPRFFGKEVVSRTPVFVIDTSGSMNELQEVPAEEVEEAKRAIEKGWRTDPVQKGEEKKEPPKAPSGKTIKMARIERAKLQLLKLIALMDPAVKFNIVAYDIEVHIFNPQGMLFANDVNKANAVKWVKSLTAQGTTHMDEGLEAAWKFVPEGCDAIYVLADGWPTHTGDPRRDGDIIEEKILKFFRKHNFMKKVVVHTLGFKGSHRSFLRKLASENNGTYKDIE